MESDLDLIQEVISRTPLSMDAVHLTEKGTEIMLAQMRKYLPMISRRGPTYPTIRNKFLRLQRLRILGKTTK